MNDVYPGDWVTVKYTDGDRQLGSMVGVVNAVGGIDGMLEVKLSDNNFKWVYPEEVEGV